MMAFLSHVCSPQFEPQSSERDRGREGEGGRGRDFGRRGGRCGEAVYVSRETDKDTVCVCERERKREKERGREEISLPLLKGSRRPSGHANAGGRCRG